MVAKLIGFLLIILSAVIFGCSTGAIEKELEKVDRDLYEKYFGNPMNHVVYFWSFVFTGMPYEPSIFKHWPNIKSAKIGMAVGILGFLASTVFWVYSHA